MNTLEALNLLRIGLEDETDLPVPVLAESQTNRRLSKLRGSGEARESTIKHALRAETSNGLRQVVTTGDSRGGQFISE